MSEILFDNIQQSLSDFFRENQYSSTVVLVDENTIKHCYPLIKNVIPIHNIIEIKSGEINKNITTCTQIWNELTNHKCDRNSLLINLGGGVIGDMGGFCASTFKRGIDFLNIPTTLLSMVDASVGGKTGVDLEGFKNQIGVFSKPQKVFIDNAFLKTLDQRQQISGAAEIIKHGCISKLDLGEIFNKIKTQNFDIELIKESIRFKQSIVESDYKESGERKILNFGHTVGHAIESYFIQNDGLLHGEAIMIGMICELFLSIKKLKFDPEVANQIIKNIRSIYSFRKMHRGEREAIAERIIQDKKNIGGEILCVLLSSKSEAKYDVAITSEEVLNSLKFYNSLV